MLKNIVATEYESGNIRALTMEFEVPDSSFDLINAVKAAVADFCKTKQGVRAFTENGNNFNWGDVVACLPDEFCMRHGFKLLDGHCCDESVDWNEQLITEDEILTDSDGKFIPDHDFEIGLASKGQDNSVTSIPATDPATPLAGEWDEYADEHILLLRSLDTYLNNKFEYVYVKRDMSKAGDSVGCLHGVIDIRDYLDCPAGLRKLDEVAKAFGHESFDDFVLENNGLSPLEYDADHGVLFDADGNIDKVNSPRYVVDLAFTASLVVEYGAAGFDGDTAIYMCVDEALDWVYKLTGKTYEFV